ncbi:MAG: hypothetical protein ABIY56_06635 [Dokdonella sp.]
MTSDPHAHVKAAPDPDASRVQGGVASEQGARHRRLLQQANTTLAASPAAALLDSVQTLHRILLAANPKALRGSVGWMGRLLGRDIVLQAESAALRTELGVHVLQARKQLDALAEIDRQLEALGIELHSAIDGMGQHAALLADGIVAGDTSSDSARDLQQLATLATSLRITASHLETTLLNHRELIHRVGHMLPRVELLLDQQSMLRSGLTEQSALQSVARSLETLQDFQRINVDDATPTLSTPDDATPR